MKPTICYTTILGMIATVAILSYLAVKAERYTGRSKDVYTLNPRSVAINPMANVAQVMLNLQNPRDCKDELNAVVNNPNVTQEDMDALYNCSNNPYDRYLIRSLPFGKNV